MRVSEDRSKRAKELASAKDRLFGVPREHLPIKRAASFSRNRANRLTLERSWGGTSRVCFIGLNPSTADHEVDDPTVRRWIHFARSWGYGGLVAVNLYPLRTSRPVECKKWADWDRPGWGPDWYARDDIQHNIQHVAEVAKASALVVACWGAVLWEDVSACLIEEIQSGIAPYPDIYCFGLTKGGQPIHPMARGKHRFPDTAKPILWKPNTVDTRPATTGERRI